MKQTRTTSPRAYSYIATAYLTTDYMENEDGSIDYQAKGEELYFTCKGCENTISNVFGGAVDSDFDCNSIVECEKCHRKTKITFIEDN